MKQFNKQHTLGTPSSINVSPSLLDSIYHGYPMLWGKWPLIASHGPQSHGGNIQTCCCYYCYNYSRIAV